MTQIELKIQRSNCYKLLASCFYEPDKQLFLQESLCENLESLLNNSNNPEAAAAAQRMQLALEESKVQELLVEYAELFIGPFELMAPPYGSLYLEEGNRLMGDTTIAVKNMYHEAGLSLDVKEAPDHIAFELEFMHFLYLNEAGAIDQGDKESAEMFAGIRVIFLKKYLAPWVPIFCEKIREKAENPFYLNLSNCLEQFIRDELEDVIPVPVAEMVTENVERTAV